ncbi:ribonuclease H2, subunit C [Scheffersomyces coipomensis]|uniref:ribonuclease H2, subunit C n=1 Tax=Scheffersomyces coipomensis TaxID=1788519 RepID=UPI00315E01DC
MSDTIQINNEVPTVIANLVPVHIEYSGPAATKEYFTPSKTSENSQDIAYFRGCKFIGDKVDFNDKYTAYIMNKSESLVRVEDNENDYNGDNVKSVSTYIPIAKFNSINVYGHDTRIAENNQWSLLKEWNEISDIIHS